MSDSGPHHDAAARHEAAAVRHERSAGFWAEQGDDERVQLHTDAAAYERTGAELERRWAAIVERDDDPAPTAPLDAWRGAAEQFEIAAEMRASELLAHEKGLGRRDRAADRREWLADERERAADARDQTADERERAADQREGTAEAREFERRDREAQRAARGRAAVAREQATVEREQERSRRDLNS